MTEDNDKYQAPPGVVWWTILDGDKPVGVILAHTAFEAWQRAMPPKPFCAYQYRPEAPEV